MGETHAEPRREGRKHEGRSHQGHSHGVAANADRRYLAIALVLLLGFMAVEVVVALVSGSLALLADAGHMLTDAGAIAASIWALNLAARPARGVWTFGFKRAEILSAAVNGITLLVVGLLVAVESVDRLIHPPEVEGGLVLVVAIVGVVVNLAATWVLGRANRTSLNVEGAFQHVLTDLYAFLATAVAAAVIMATGFTRADAIASLVVVALMLRAAYSLLRASGRILLEAAPEQVDLPALRSHLLEIEHVTDVHDLHAWSVTSDLPALSAHVVVADGCFDSGHCPQILDQLQACLRGHFDVEHSTFQLEPAGHADHEDGAHP
ncbi:cation diffusion facilitator family transporter [Rhodococcus sp. X156]|uniref:cation diffusion facilitator family transporter n=1 Tax=Rhodococcus sp. X156 TaxID=2499145 RepID=UPI000FDBBDA7|nr:cation diffusion facilitator family transporter [Rhodococcus sp. X156]